MIFPGQHHAHLWLDTDAPGWFVCESCEATAHQCATCRALLTHDARTCSDCESRARLDLYAIRDAYRALPDVIAAVAGLHAVRYDRGGGGKPKRAADTQIIGGAALVMAGGGTWDKTKLGRSETTIDPALLDAERHDPPSVLAVLTFWEDAWRQERGQAAAQATSVDAAVTYLTSLTAWAAQESPTWEEYRTDVRALLHRLHVLTGDWQPPREEPAPCVHCGGTVERQWTDDGLDDVARCARCGMTWPSEDRLRHTNHLTVLALPITHPDQLVTAEDARVAVPDLKRNTLNQVIKRDRDHGTDPGWTPRLPVMGKDERGRDLYRLADITALVAGSSITEEAS